jgi:FKBP-type peptidyl-prolyl cis-trans isomerase SlyD
MSDFSRKDLLMSTDSVKDGVVVSMEYTLHVDGELLDTSESQGPLQFLAGYGNIIPGLESEMRGMKIGESKDVVVQPADGYGEFDDEAFMNVPRDQFPKDMELAEGTELTVRDDEGNARYARVDNIEGDTVTLNFNHPLAGDELHFHVKVVALREPSAEELEHGHVHEAGHHH